jgi:hypothetical protein
MRRKLELLKREINKVAYRVAHKGKSGFFSRAPPNYNSSNNVLKLMKLKRNLKEAQATYNRGYSTYLKRLKELNEQALKMSNENNVSTMSKIPMHIRLALREEENRHAKNPWAGGVSTRPYPRN